MPKVGDAINLAAQLSEKDVDRFIRARVFEPDGDEISGSPVTLSHRDDGLYTNEALVMPDFERVHAVYETFDNAGLTTKSTKYPSPITESFLKDELNSAFDDLLDAVVKADMIAEISDESEVEGAVSDEDTIEGLIDDSDLHGSIDESDEIDGTIDESDLVAEIEDC